MTRASTEKRVARDTQAFRQAREKAALKREMAEQRQTLEARSPATDEARRDMVREMLGAVRNSLQSAVYHRALTLVQLKNIKENKLYRDAGSGASYDPEGNKIANVSTWEGFCQALGVSHQKVDEDLRNMAAFGEDNRQLLMNIGVGYRQLRTIRQLPAEQREILVNSEAVQAGDRDQVLSLIEDLVDRHQAEKRDLEKKSADLEVTLEAARTRIGEKDARINALADQLARRDQLGPEARAKELYDQLHQATSAAAEALLQPRLVIRDILEWDRAPRDLQHACAQAVARLRLSLQELQSTFGLPDAEAGMED